METRATKTTDTLYALNGLPVEIISIGATYACPECGSFLDAPRIHPGSGQLARKCAPCQGWYLLTELHGGAYG